MTLLDANGHQRAYQVDVVFYAILLASMAATQLIAGPSDRKALTAIASGLGFLAWPLIEYGLHRFVLHGFKPFSTWHARHHHLDDPYVCMPTVFSATLMATLVFMPAVALAGFWSGMGFTFGVLAGYRLYAATHHAIHHEYCKSAWIMQRKFCHALHHDAQRPAGYYGVTSSLWDQIMGTRHRHEF